MFDLDFIVHRLNFKDLQGNAYTSTSENLCSQRDGIILCGELVSDKIIHLKKRRHQEKRQMRHDSVLDSRGINVNLWLQSYLDCEERVSPVLYACFSFAGNHSQQLFEHSRLHSGMTCREFDSFLRGNTDELREKTCKILFIDTIRIPDRETKSGFK